MRSGLAGEFCGEAGEEGLLECDAAVEEFDGVGEVEDLARGVDVVGGGGKEQGTMNREQGTGNREQGGVPSLSRWDVDVGRVAGYHCPTRMKWTERPR